MSVPARRYITPEEYLEIERAAEFRSEYCDGELFAMAGGSPAHSLIIANVIATLRAAVRDRGCRVYSADLRIQVRATGLYTYPDITVVCGDLRTRDEDRETALNPTLIVEVLSPSTEAYDRGVKFTHYQSLESLQEYVLVSQERPLVETFRREPEGSGWRYSACGELTGSLSLGSLGCELPLSEVYLQVDFPEGTTAESRSR